MAQQNEQPGAGSQMFLAVGAFLLAFWIMPDTSDIMQSQGVLYRWFFAGLLAVGGISAVVKALRAGSRSPSPWHSPTGRILWFFRPRGWMIAWAVILGAVWIWGTPHILFTYPAEIMSREPCTYVGLKGRVTIPMHGGSRNGCDLVSLF